jgi:hypothetical protein
MTEAVYLCLIKHDVPTSLKDDLILHIYNKNIYMYIYLCWLLERWYPLYSQHINDLPKKYSD